MLTPWQQFIQFITDGENVNADVANRAPYALAQRTQHLYDILKQALAGEALFLHDVPIDPDTEIGAPLYFDAASGAAGVYKPALARVELDTEQGFYVVDKSAYVIGLLINKTAGGTRGSIITLGAIRELDISAAVDDGDATIPGAYFLSADKPGKLTRTKPPVGVYVLYNRGDGGLHVAPTPRDLLEAHVHYRIPLDNTHWDSTNIPDFAPPGTEQWYKIDDDENLKPFWPPVPAEPSVIEADGVTMSDDDVIVDSNGIWWMSATSPDGGTEYVLWFTKMIFRTDKTVVTALYPAEGSPITVVDCEGEPDSRGRLHLGLALDALDTVPGDNGEPVVQGFDGSDVKVVPAVNTLRAGAGIVIEDDGAHTEDDGAWSGELKIALADPSITARELGVSLVALNNVRETVVDDEFQIYFPADRVSDYLGRVEIPDTAEQLPAGALEASLRLWVLSRSPGLDVGNPSLLSVRRRKLDGSIVEPTPPVEIDTSGVTNFDVVDSTTFTVERGDTIFFRLGWDGTSSAEPAILRQCLLVTPA